MKTRTNLHLDDDALAFASYFANANGLSLGAGISELIRRFEHGGEMTSSKLVMTEDGLLVRAKTGRVITPEMVKELSEDDFDEFGKIPA